MYHETESALCGSGQDYAELWYEDLFSPNGLDPALGLLGIEGRPTLPEGQTHKLTPPALRETIANFDALAQQLRGSDLEAELHETGR